MRVATPGRAVGWGADGAVGQGLDPPRSIRGVKGGAMGIFAFVAWLSSLGVPGVAPGAPAAEALWRSAETCVEARLVRRVPATIAALDALARRDPRAAGRCWRLAGRLALVAGRPRAAARWFTRAARSADPDASRRAALEHAAAIRALGRHAAARRVVLRSMRGGAFAEAHVTLARVALDAGYPLDAAHHVRVARALACALPRDRSAALAPTIAVVDGATLEARGERDAAIERYLATLAEHPDSTATDPRVAFALARLHRPRAATASLRARLRPLAARGGPFSGAALLDEYLSLRELVDQGNVVGLLAEVEGFDPLLFRGDEGADWPLFAAMRDLVDADRDRAFAAVVDHMGDRGYSTMAAYALGRLGDARSLRVLHRFARAHANARDLSNLTLAIAQGEPTLADALLRRLQSDGSVAHPARAAAAASFALDRVPPTTP